MIPIGLWMTAINIGEKFGFTVDIEGLDKIIDNNFDEKKFKDWCQDFFSDHPKFKPRDYQIDSAIAILKYRLSTSEIATSAGKTLITFLVYGYLKHINVLQKFLVIVPNTTLVMQMRDDWDDYNNGKLKMKIRQVYGGSRENDPDAEIIVGTYQSLCKKTIDFYKGVNVVFSDESHSASTVSVRNILSKTVDSVYRFGMSGTLKEDESADFTTITAVLGPMVNSIPPRFLFEEGYATPVKFKIIVLDHNKPLVNQKLYDMRRFKDLEGSKILAIEKQLIIQNDNRFKFMLNMIKNTTKNSMVLFSNVKDKYGRNMYDWLRENSDKECYYVDGNVGNDHRDFYKKEMEHNNNKILFASFTTFAQGVSIKNIHNLFLCESYKSEIIIKQTIGRGMRQMTEGKDSFTVIDFVDDLSYQKHRNYLYKHGAARLDFYKGYSDNIKIIKIKL